MANQEGGMTKRGLVLRALRQWGQPVCPSELARWMGEDAQSVRNSLSALYSMDLVNRKLNPVGYPWRHLYVAKRVVG